VLPIRLKSFSGKAGDAYNLLEWVTLSEKNVQWHIVERSANGLTWSETGRLPGRADSQAPLSYKLEDRQPLARAYYRLRSVDFDGSASVSQLILLNRPTETFAITAAFPSPATDDISVQFNDPSEEEIRIRLTDLSGRTVLEQTFVAEKGINTVSLSLRQLPAGVYAITLDNGLSVSEPMRVVKQ
jgi:hypothetical protein